MTPELQDLENDKHKRTAKNKYFPRKPNHEVIGHVRGLKQKQETFKGAFIFFLDAEQEHMPYCACRSILNDHNSGAPGPRK